MLSPILILFLLAGFPNLANLEFLEAIQKDVTGGFLSDIVSSPFILTKNATFHINSTNTNRTTIVFVSTESANSVFQLLIHHTDNASNPYFYDNFRVLLPLSAEANHGIVKGLITVPNEHCLIGRKPPLLAYYYGNALVDAGTEEFANVANGTLTWLEFDNGLSVDDPRGRMAVVKINDSSSFVFWVSSRNNPYAVDLRWSEVISEDEVCSFRNCGVLEDLLEPGSVHLDESSGNVIDLSLDVSSRRLVGLIEQYALFATNVTVDEILEAAKIDYSPSISLSVEVNVFADRASSLTGVHTHGVGPDGRVIVQSSDPDVMGYSDDYGRTWTEVNQGMNSVGWGIEFAVRSTTHPAQYDVFFGKKRSFDRGETWEWMDGSHGNTGATDPINPNIVYFQTTRGMSISIDSGDSDTRVTKGLYAVQITDIAWRFDPVSAVSVGFVTADQGLWKVHGLDSGAEDWAFQLEAKFRSVAMASPSVVFVGDNTLRKSVVGDQFEQKWYCWDTNWGFVEGVQGAITSIFTWEGVAENVVVFTFRKSHVEFQGTGVPSVGTVFYSVDSGETWTQIGGTAGCNPNSAFLSPSRSSLVRRQMVVYVGCDNGLLRLVFPVIALSPSVTVGTPALTTPPVRAVAVSNMSLSFLGSVAMTSSDFGIRNFAEGKTGNIFATGFIRTALDAELDPDRPEGGGGSGGETNLVGRLFLLRNDTLGVGDRWWALPLDVLGVHYVRYGGVDSHELPRAITVGNVTDDDVIVMGVGRYLFSLDRTGFHEVYAFPQATKVYVIRWDDLVIGTSVGLFGSAHTGTVDVFPDCDVPSQFCELVCFSKTDSQGACGGTQGTCISADDCDCELGYSGDECEVALCPSGCIHGECASPNHCDCDNGYQGDRCDDLILGGNSGNSGRLVIALGELVGLVTFFWLL